MATNGGQIVRIRGSNLGAVNNPGSVVRAVITNVHAASTPDVAFTGNVSGCVRSPLGVGNEEVNCLAPEGHGAHHRWVVYVSRIDFVGMSWNHTVSYSISTSYTLPSISTILDGENLRTSGGQNVTLEGANLGPGDREMKLYAQYGPEGVGLCAKTCRITVPHVQMVCQSSKGRRLAPLCCARLPSTWSTACLVHFGTF